MPKRLTPLYPLTGRQNAASEPSAQAWLSASAGTGKTQVLTARVLRLLLAGVDPASILCLTFTKAGAAEMADRIHARLAYWVRLKDTELANELTALGERCGPEERARARKLFARVLDATGGGLDIRTIHAFCQSLLGAFPVEAGMIPGFRPLEPREESLLIRETLSDMLVAAEEHSDARLISDIQALSRRFGEEGAEGFLVRCAHAQEAMEALGPPELIEDRLRRGLDVPLGDIEAAIAEWCADHHFECAALRQFAAANRQWGTKTGLARVETCEAWLAAPPEQRAQTLFELRRSWITTTGTFNQTGMAKLEAIDGNYSALLEGLDEAVESLLAMRAKAEFAAFAAAGLRAGQQFALDYADAKRRKGAVDFDDLIRKARDLLTTPGIGDWVRYKLDRQIDHILVDEAQDTNADQWSIVAALAGEFFEGDPEVPGEAVHRTIFAVGDFKQAIFSFQGTDPWEFEAARRIFRSKAEEAGREFRDLSLARSYRSTPPVLKVVDQVMTTLGPEAVGLVEALEPHESGRGEGDLPGRVTLWDPVAPLGGDDIAEAEEGWLADSALVYARNLAAQLRDWLSPDPDKRLWLAAKGRALRPEDVIILLRSRGELASLIVARLHQEGVPVAGIDRLLLTDPLAVQDLLAALRFALQPQDDLALANLLVSPLFGWSQEDLYALAKGRRATSLWSALRDRGEAHGDTLAGIRDILDRADLVTPYRLLEHILSGPLDGRRKILKRLGEEARDPIEELLNAALQFEADHPPSLQHFLDWFDRGDAEVTRDPSAPLDAVRVMTVHGAKGLQAPLVILADATRDPANIRPRSINYAVEEEDEPRAKVPLPVPRREERFGRLADAADAAARADREEHWRLLYVALTRAEEHLVVGGALGARAKDGVAPEESWYAVVAQAMEALEAEVQDDPLWGQARHFADGREAKAVSMRQRRRPPEIEAPDWLHEPAPREARPPRPLAPSSIGPDAVADPPPGEEQRRAAERGVLLHRLFERLPELAAGKRAEAADRWLAQSAGIESAEERAPLVEAALSVLGDARFAELFGPEALAEAPIAAVVDEVVIAGTVDRLLVTDDGVTVIDFKTGRRVPDTIDAVPEAHIRQMAAYAAALGVIYPDRSIQAGLLYTAGPEIVMVPDNLIAAHRPRPSDSEQALSPIA